MNPDTPIARKPLYGATPLFSPKSTPRYALSDTSPSRIEPVSSEILADLESVNWKTLAPETWITSLRRLQKYLTYQWILLARQARQIFDDNGAASFQDRHRLEEGIQLIWTIWKDYVSADVITPDVLYNSPAYFDFKTFNRRFRKPRGQGGVKVGKKMNELLSSAKDLHMLSHQIQQILEDVPLRLHNLSSEEETSSISGSSPKRSVTSRSSDGAFTTFTTFPQGLYHLELAEDVVRELETASNRPKGLFQQYLNTAIPPPSTNSQDPLKSDARPESPVPGSNQRPEWKGLDIGVGLAPARTPDFPVAESTTTLPESPRSSVVFEHLTPFDKKPVPENDLLVLIKPRGASESEYGVILKSRLENPLIDPLDSPRFLQPYLGTLWQNQNYWSIYHDTIRTPLRDYLKNVVPQFVLAPMSLIVPDPKSKTGVTSHPLVLIVVPESHIQSLSTDSLVGGVTKEFLVGIATGGYNTYASTSYRHVRPGNPIELVTRQEVTEEEPQVEQKSSAIVHTSTTKSHWKAATIGPCFEQTDSKQRTCLTVGHMCLNKKDHKMVDLGTSVYCPGVIHFQAETALCETEIRQQNTKIEAIEDDLAYSRSEIEASDLDEDELQERRDRIVESEEELALHKGELQKTMVPRLEKIRNKLRNVKDCRFGELAQTEYEVVQYCGRSCISDWALINIDKGRDPVKSVRKAVKGPSGGVLGAQVWAPYSGKVKELSHDQYVYKEGYITGITFGFMGGLMDVKASLALPGGDQIIETEEYFVLSEDWTIGRNQPFGEAGDSSSQVVESGGDAVGVIHGGVEKARVRLVLNTEGKPDILSFRRGRRTGESLDANIPVFTLDAQITAVMSLKMICERSGQKEENLMQC